MNADKTYDSFDRRPSAFIGGPKRLCLVIIRFLPGAEYRKTEFGHGWTQMYTDKIKTSVICVYLCPSVAHRFYCANPSFAAAFTISAAAGAAFVPPYTPFSTNTDTAILRVPVP
jgi:hypothetical protein